MKTFRLFVLLLGVAALGLSPAVLRAQSAGPANIVNSPSVLGARKCLDGLAKMGRDANFYTDRDGVYSMVLHPSSKAALLPLLIASSDCLDEAFPKNEIVEYPATGVKSRAWYVALEGQYVWCASSSLENNVESIDVLGGNGPKLNWHAVIVKCGIDEKVLGWYDPDE